MAKFILKRLIAAIPVLFAVVTLTFFLIRLAPGGPFDSEKTTSPEVLKNLNQHYKLDAPVYLQYLDYLKNLANGDFGPSFRYPGRTVNEMIATGFPITFELGIYALLIALTFGILTGVFAALKPNSNQDHIPMAAAMTGICIPSFLLGPLLMLIFGIWLKWLPVSGWGDMPGDKILPSITLGAAYAAYIARLSRSGIIEIMTMDFIRMARAKGLPESIIVIRHALRGGLLPVISFIGPAAAGLLSGSFVIETIFQIPGLGRFFIQAAFNRDYTMIMGTTIFFAALIILFNLITDLIIFWLNPRLRHNAIQET